MDPWYIDPVHLTIRLVLAVLLGGLIGLEREQSNHAAGFRTHILVCLGATLITLLSIYGFKDFASETNVRLDPARLAAQVVSGIGFLGAGAIMSSGMKISGLTTAASLWVVAAIGLSVGAGFYYPASLATFLALMSLWVLNKLERKFIQRKRTHSLQISGIDYPGNLGRISKILRTNGIEIRKVDFHDDAVDEKGVTLISMTFMVNYAKQELIAPLIEEIRALDGVSGVVFE